MAQVKWAREPNSGFYVATIMVDNKHFYATGVSLSALEKNIKQNADHQGTDSRNFYVGPNPVKWEELDFTFASKMFMSKLRKLMAGTSPRVMTNNIKPAQPVEKKDKDTNKQYITNIIDGVMYVFELKEVAQYKLYNTPSTLDNWVDEEHTDPGVMLNDDVDFSNIHHFETVND